MKALIRYFATKHVLVNLFTLLIFVGGIITWNIMSKEELPDVTFNFVRISTTYSGASAEDVEFYITKPIEEVLESVDYIHRITSTSSPGNSSISIELDPDAQSIDDIVTEIRNQVGTVDLPDDVLDDPRIRIFETSKKAIIDIAIYNTEAPLLSTTQRLELQHIARSLDSRLTSEPEIFECQISGYLTEEITINADPTTFYPFDVSLSEIAQEIRRNNIRAPSGTLKSGQFEQVTLLSELTEKSSLENLVIQGGFDSIPVKLKSLATITDSFEDQQTIFKVNGYEAIMLNVVKNNRYGILESLDVVKKVVERFENTTLSQSSYEIAFLDDESLNVRNRLSIITSNGVLGFILITISLLFFLNKRSGIWVALGIPFTLCTTLIASYFMGYTINGVTLAGIIIVLGIVVDDAIIVAENISRHFQKNKNLTEASIEGTYEVAAPILASILTTCVAFIPLFFFSGRYGNFVKYIPPIIFLMLIASLIESFLLLPSHMTLFSKGNKPPKEKKWFKTWEKAYRKFIHLVLPFRYLVFILFTGLLVYSGHIVKEQFNFVMFPDEESREIVISGIATDAQTPVETARAIQPLETILRTYLGKEGIGIRTDVARGRRGDAAMENQFRSTLEITSKEEREKSANDIIEEIKLKLQDIPELSDIRFRKNRFGQSSGSVFEIVILENDDAKREALGNALIAALETHPDIANPEQDIIPSRKEYLISFDQKELKRLSVNPETIASTLRTILSGSRLYTVIRNDEDVNVFLTVDESFTQTIDKALTIPVANAQGYLVPLEDLVDVKEIEAKRSIRRYDQKRSSFIYADLNSNSEKSPLDVADELEATVFPEILASFPSSQLRFDGEIIDTRESKRDLFFGILSSIALIYIILAILFDSVLKPLRIMAIIPFGAVGVVLAFYFHEKTLFGFYASIGTLGMLGVIVNDAIVMLSKLDKTEKTEQVSIDDVSDIASTRLRAILLTTLTTVAGVMPTAYGFGGTDMMLSDMMLALAWGLLFGTFITLILTPCIFMLEQDIKKIGSLQFGKLLPVSMIGLLLIPFLSTPLSARDTMLSMEDFISKSMENDTQFHAILDEHMTLAYDHILYAPIPELTLSVDSGFALDFNDSGTHRIDVTQTHPQTGKEYRADYTQSSSGIGTSTFSFSQDIAKNAFGASAILEQSLQELETEIAHIQLVEAYEDYLAELINVYYTWIRQYESIRLAKAALIENEKVLESIKNRRLRKIADDTDVNKLTLQTLTKREQLIDLEQAYRETTNTITRSLGLDPDTEIAPNSTFTLDQMPDKRPLSLDELNTESRTNTLLSTLKKQSAVEYNQATRNLLPSIALSSSLVHSTETYGEIGVSIDLPISNAVAKAEQRVAEINQGKVVNETLSVETQLITDLSTIYSAMQRQKEKIRIASEKKRLSKAILEAESDNYSFGKISLNDYISAVNGYDTSRFEEIDRRISYQRLSLEWKRLTDTLLSTSEFLK